MYAIVEIAGLQYKVEQDQKLFVNRLQAEEGDMVVFDRVLLSDNGKVEVGAPVIEGMAVEAKVIGHVRGDKVIVFKKKRRKGYRVKNGYRSSLTEIEIVSVGTGKGSGSSKKASKTKAPKAKAEAPKAKATAAEKTSEAKKKAAPAKKTDKQTASTKATSAKSKSTGKGDDLTKVEGIGPKVKGIFNDNGIMTFADLAAKSPEELKNILTPHGGRYAGMTTDTWPKQAKLAADGKWDELKEWQDQLDGGKE